MLEGNTCTFNTASKCFNTFFKKPFITSRHIKLQWQWANNFDLMGKYVYGLHTLWKVDAVKMNYRSTTWDQNCAI